jgi:hypothetical protein
MGRCGEESVGERQGEEAGRCVPISRYIKQRECRLEGQKPLPQMSPLKGIGAPTDSRVQCQVSKEALIGCNVANL